MLLFSNNSHTKDKHMDREEKQNFRRRLGEENQSTFSHFMRILSHIVFERETTVWRKVDIFT